MYYACFYAATALLLSRGLTATKHTGVRAVPHQYFVRSGDVPRDLARTYDTLFDNRLEGDYEALTTFAPEDVSAWLEKAVRFVAQAEQLLGGEGAGT